MEKNQVAIAVLNFDRTPNSTLLATAEKAILALRIVYVPTLIQFMDF